MTDLNEQLSLTPTVVVPFVFLILILVISVLTCFCIHFCIIRRKVKVKSNNIKDEDEEEKSDVHPMETETPLSGKEGDNLEKESSLHESTRSDVHPIKTEAPLLERKDDNIKEYTIQEKLDSKKLSLPPLPPINEHHRRISRLNQTDEHAKKIPSPPNKKFREMSLQTDHNKPLLPIDRSSSMKKMSASQTMLPRLFPPSSIKKMSVLPDINEQTAKMPPLPTIRKKPSPAGTVIEEKRLSVILTGKEMAKDLPPIPNVNWQMSTMTLTAASAIPDKNTSEWILPESPKALLTSESLSAALLPYDSSLCDYSRSTDVNLPSASRNTLMSLLPDVNNIMVKRDREISPNQTEASLDANKQVSQSSHRLNLKTLDNRVNSMSSQSSIDSNASLLSLYKSD